MDNMDNEKIEIKDGEKEVKAEKASKKASKEAEKQIKELQKQIEEKNAEIAALSDKYMRIVAEYENFRKRSQKERENIYNDSYGDCLKAFLPVFDNLSRATQYSDGENAIKGVQMIVNQFYDVLQRNNITPFGKAGEEFNPELHNAVMMVQDENLGENVIAEVLQEGYKIGDKVIRYAMVKVAN